MAAGNSRFLFCIWIGICVGIWLLARRAFGLAVRHLVSRVRVRMYVCAFFYYMDYGVCVWLWFVFCDLGCLRFCVGAAASVASGDLGSCCFCWCRPVGPLCFWVRVFGFVFLGSWSDLYSNVNI